MARKATLCTVKHSVPGRLKVQVCCDFMLRVSFFTFFAAELAIDTHELHLRLSFIKQSITRCEHNQEPAQNAWYKHQSNEEHWKERQAGQRYMYSMLLFGRTALEQREKEGLNAVSVLWGKKVPLIYLQK